MYSDGISAVTHTTAVLAPYAVQSAADELSTPGPGTTVYTPTLPVDLAYPKAMYAQACSCRGTMTRISGVRASASNRAYVCTPGIPNTVSTPLRSSDWTIASPPVMSYVSGSWSACRSISSTIVSGSSPVSRL